MTAEYLLDEARRLLLWSNEARILVPRAEWPVQWLGDFYSHRDGDGECVLIRSDVPFAQAKSVNPYTKVVRTRVLYRADTGAA